MKQNRNGWRNLFIRSQVNSGEITIRQARFALEGEHRKRHSELETLHASKIWAWLDRKELGDVQGEL